MSSPKLQPDTEHGQMGSKEARGTIGDGVGMLEHRYMVLVDQDNPGMAVDQLVKSLNIKDEEVAMLQDCEAGVNVDGGAKPGDSQIANKAKGVGLVKQKKTPKAAAVSAIAKSPMAAVAAGEKQAGEKQAGEKQAGATCPDCHAVFARKNSLKEHLKTGLTCQRRKERERKKAEKVDAGNGRKGFRCKKCDHIFTTAHALKRHREYQPDCDRPRITCHTTSDHVHDWFYREFESEQEFQQFWYDEKWDGQFTRYNKKEYKSTYRCSRRGKNIKAKNFTKKNVNCGAYLQLSLPQPTDLLGKKVVLQGCISHCHALDKVSTRIPKKDKDEMMELSQQGVSNAVLMERYGAVMTSVHRKHGKRYIARSNTRKKKLTEIPQLRDRVLGKIAKMSQRIAEAKETHVGTYDALSVLDDWLDKALKMPSEPGSLHEIYKASGGGVTDFIPSFRIGHRQTQTEKEYLEPTTVLNEAQVQTDDIELRSAVQTILPDNGCSDDVSKNFVIFDKDNNDGSDGEGDCDDEDDEAMPIPVENDDFIHTVVEDVEVEQVSPLEFVQSMLPNGTILYKQGEEKQRHQKPPEQRDEQKKKCLCKNAQKLNPNGKVSSCRGQSVPECINSEVEEEPIRILSSRIRGRHKFSKH